MDEIETRFERNLKKLEDFLKEDNDSKEKKMIMFKKDGKRFKKYVYEHNLKVIINEKNINSERVKLTLKKP